MCHFWTQQGSRPLPGSKLARTGGRPSREPPPSLVKAGAWEDGAARRCVCRVPPLLTLPAHHVPQHVPHADAVVQPRVALSAAGKQFPGLGRLPIRPRARSAASVDRPQRQRLEHRLAVLHRKCKLQVSAEADVGATRDGAHGEKRCRAERVGRAAAQDERHGEVVCMNSAGEEERRVG